MAKRKPGSRLTHTFVKSVTEPGSYGDGPGGQGLRLVVKKRSKGGVSKIWNQRIRINSKRVDLGLGSFPVVILAEAREKALDNQRRVAQGEDIRKPAPTIPTVAAAFEELITARAPSWKGVGTKESWYRHLGYCKEIRSTLVSEVTEDEVIKLLIPLWHDKPNTAQQLRIALSAIMYQAIRKGHRVVANPVPVIKELTRSLGKQPPKVHHKSLNYRQLGNALATVRDADTWWAAKYCLIFIAFTCVRSGEARKATWEEIDLNDSTWTIPADRMKKSIEHKVPLSNQAKELLAHAREQSGRSQGIIFPPERGGQSMYADRLSRLLQRLRIPFVPHGVRSSFRNWAGGRGREHMAQPAAGMVLAHKQLPEIELEYMTEDFFEHREPIMQEWADYLTETMGPVISTIPDVYERRASSRVRTFKLDPIGEYEYTLVVQNLQESQTQDTWDAPDQDTLRGAVDVAAIALMRDGLLRPKETADARWSDLKREADGSGLLNIRSSKKNRPGTDHVAYVSPRTMKALDETRRIRRELRMDAKDDRILQMTADALPKHIPKACHAAGLTGTFGGFSPRNGMAQDLIRSGVGVNNLKKEKGWILMATTHSERESLARNGAVAQWYAQKETETKETRPVVQADLTSPSCRTEPTSTPIT